MVDSDVEATPTRGRHYCQPCQSSVRRGNTKLREVLAVGSDVLTCFLRSWFECHNMFSLSIANDSL